MGWTLWTKIIILDNGNFTWAHRYKKHRIEFASGATVAEFLYGVDIMDKNNYHGYWEFHLGT